MSVTELPTRGIPFQVSGKEIWDAPEPNDRQVWGVCPYLRNLERCKGCPEWEADHITDEDGEQIKRGCRMLAEEACRIVMAAADPHLPSGTPKPVAHQSGAGDS